MAEYVSTIAAWVGSHPYVAYTLVFFAALIEAIPVAGVFVPGSVTIIAISALVPSSGLGLWPLLIAAIAGAIAGDGLAFWLGRRFHREILGRWPLNRYPRVAASSEAFFLRHGGKSVFLGRFTPALRAFVPLFAGILHMPARRFYVSNVLSALIWAPAHVIPGVLLGASLSLAGAVAGRLAALLLALLAVAWLSTWAVRYAIRRGLPLAEAMTARSLAWARGGDSWARRSLLALFDPNRKEFRVLLALAGILIGAAWVFLGVLEDVATGDTLVRADTAVYDLLQELRTPIGDVVMVAVTELGDSRVVIAVSLAALGWLAWQRAWRTMAYWIAAVSLASGFNTAIKVALTRPRPVPELYQGWGAFSFPSGHTTVNAAMYGFLVFLVARELRPAWKVPTVAAAMSIIFMIALSRLYLGAHWLSDVVGGLAFGTTWIAVLAIAYGHHRPQRVRARGLLAIVGVTLILAGGTNISLRNATDRALYAVREETRTLALGEWWDGGWRELPAHRIGLTGGMEEPLTVQWAGDLALARKRLLGAGWIEAQPWSARAALSWLAPVPDPLGLPAWPLLQEGRVPAMTLVHPLAGDARLVLRLWATSVLATDGQAAPEPLWVGAVAEEHLRRPLGLLTVSTAVADATGPRQALAASVDGGGLVQRIANPPTPAWDGRVLLVR